jgi:hypothetical protein
MDYMDIIKKDPGMFPEIPQEFLTKEICEYIMDIDKNMIEFIPEKFMSETVCRKALEANIANEYYIPTCVLSAELREWVWKYYRYLDEQNDYQKSFK